MIDSLDWKGLKKRKEAAKRSRSNEQFDFEAVAARLEAFVEKQRKECSFTRRHLSIKKQR